LQPTALVHEAYLRLVGNQSQKWTDARISAARRRGDAAFLIENARRKHAARHGGGQARLDINKLKSPLPQRTTNCWRE